MRAINVAAKEAACPVREPASFVAEVRGQTGRGSIGIGGELGYEGLRVTLLSGWPCYETISAHAPSELEIVTTKPFALMGFMDITSKFRGECRFWVDENWLGDIFYPGNRTPEIVLDAGRHRLDVTALDKDNRHSVWGLRPVSVPDSNSECATPENTAVVVISAYAERCHGRHACQFLTASARRHDIYLHVRGIGEKYDHVQCKIIRLCQWIEELPDRYRSILYVDARDSIFLRDLGACCAAFNRCGQPILMGTERNCHPVSDADWRESFPRHPSNRRWPNSGVFFGRRRELVSALKLLRRLSEQESFPAYVTYRSDQFIWQWAWRQNLLPIAFDFDCDLVTNVFAQDTRISSDNPDFIFGPELIVRDSGARPAIAHFNGLGADSDLQAWASFFRAV